MKMKVHLLAFPIRSKLLYLSYSEKFGLEKQAIAQLMMLEAEYSKRPN